jgi:hypothetical protein
MNKNSKESIERAIKLMGRKPINPIGECFESSIQCLLNPKLNDEIIKLKNVKLCHGIGITNFNNENGEKFAHSWIEYEVEGGKIAIDTTWGLQISALKYRKDLQLNYVVEYTPQKALKNWEKGVPPWNKKIRKIIDDYKK